MEPVLMNICEGQEQYYPFPRQNEFEEGYVFLLQRLWD